MRDHAVQAYPKECCGVMLGLLEGEQRVVTLAVPCRNAYEGDQSDRFFLDPADQLAAQKRARAEDLEVLGFFHSHPDCDAYFSRTDLENSWPWYSNVVLSVREGRIVQAGSFQANDERTESTEEPLQHPAFERS